MIFKNLLLFVTVVSLLTFSAINAQERNEEARYIKNNKKQPDISYQTELRHSAAWQHFLKSNGDWYVVFNEQNALPHKAFGKPIQVSGATLEEKALDFINNELSEFKIPVDGLQLQKAFGSDKFDYVNFYQTYNGLKVLDSRFTVKMTKAGEVILFGADVYSDVEYSVSTTAELLSADAALKAREGLTSKITATTVRPDLFILPIPDENRKGQNIYKLVYEVMVDAKQADGLPAKYRVLVDAHNGEILYRKNKVHTAGGNSASTDINVQATVTIDNPYKGNTVVNLSNLRTVVSGSTYYTDSLGNISITSGNPSSATFYMDGYWSDVEIDGGSVATVNFNKALNTGNNSISFDADASIRERSAYYNVNVIHDQMKKYLPSFTDMDSPLPTYVDVTGSGTCNAFYDGASINFLEEGGGCYCLAQIGGVVYHEYGHGISDKFYLWQNSSFDNGAMGEGYSDVWAFSLTLDPVLAKGYETADSTTYIRRYDEDIKIYPQDLVGEVHADGEIIAGAWWDLYQSMGSMDQMMKLFSECMYALITGPDGTEGEVFTDILVEALTNDDDDADITNGTPNDSIIVEAFARHGITLLSNAELDHTAVDDVDANIDVDIDVEITLTYAWALSKARVYYYINADTTSWNSVDLTNTGGNKYAADIPAQPMGTVIGYYITLEDLYGKISGALPVAAELDNPNIPYFILVGFAQKHLEDFDSYQGSWKVGLSSDNATTGEWEIGFPTGSYTNPFDLTTVVQPNEQHTDGGAVCAYTGNASSAVSALGENDVDDGVTTLESPTFDLEEHTNPVVVYYRWYINNPPTGANPGNDYWEVHITDDGSNWVKLERTNVADKSWRKYAFRVTDYVAKTSKFKIRFMASDSIIPGEYLDGGSIVEAAIDDLTIYDEDDGSSINEIQLTDFSMFPNPTSDKFFIRFSAPQPASLGIEIYNTMGETVYSVPAHSINAGFHQMGINMNTLPAGIYVAQINYGDTKHMERITLLK